MSGKFEILSGNCQGNVREFCFLCSVATLALPVLASQFFKINYSNTLKNTIFHDSRSNINSLAHDNNYCVENRLENKFLFEIDKMSKM